MALPADFPTLCANPEHLGTMRKLLIIPLIALPLCVSGAYAVWIRETPTSHFLSDLSSAIDSDHGTANGQANLLSLDPALYPADYQSPERLRLKLAAALDKARETGLLTPRTVVALPDQIGTWLILGGEKPQLYSARSFDEARHLFSLNNPVALTRTWLLADKGLSLPELLLRMKAQQAADDYLRVFGELARDYRITLHAGSILLPEPRMEGPRLKTGYGNLYNFSLTFDADGMPLQPAYSQPWPAASDGQAVQEEQLGDTHLTVLRSGPISTLQLTSLERAASGATLLRGQLWAVEAGGLRLELTAPTARQAKGAPATYLHNRWLGEG